ncbi:axin-2 isoform X2 [Scyliorhinus canicula]|uniref:axin-2 isoform X2 n=1 Tax=Scyliorhinus canicula TaxID=7830 RepID=UPI0018F7C8F0|nr:axin-2 isoform X2 [Scyliorhinus canicula]
MSTALMVSCLPYASSFRADAPRPPVPGEEGDRCQAQSSQATKTQSLKPKAVTYTPRREDDELGEPEGSASPDSPLTRWTKSLHSLLGDQDGAHLFRTFLEREKGVDTLDFWFACNGFRQMDLRHPKTLRVAKAIHKRYVENSAVSRQLKSATKSYIKDSIKKQQIDSAMFDQAQTEIQTLMEENSYQMFLTSDIYLQYVRTGGENSLFASNTELGSIQVVCGYLPTLNEEEEWICPDLGGNNIPPGVGLTSKALRATASVRSTDGSSGKCYRSYGRNGPVNPYHVQAGSVFAPASSANDSEISSDVMTDDSMSMTDSSVDGIPPYRHKKQQQREMHRSVRANGQVSLPHFPRTHRLPKEMTPVDPAAFATQLIARLEKLKRERDTMNSLEERLQQIKEDEGEDGEVPIVKTQMETEPAPPHHQLHPLTLLPSGSCEEDPQTILDDHLSRVLKTPGCQSPGVGRCSPPSQAPDCLRGTKFQPALGPQANPPGVSSKGYVSKQSTKYVHHHHIHHHTVPKTKEQMEAEAAQRVQCLCPTSFCPNSTDCSYAKSRSHSKVEMPTLQVEQFAIGGRSSSLPRRSTQVTDCDSPISSEGALPPSIPQLPGEETDRAQNVWQWMLESERQPSKHRPHSVQYVKRGGGTDSPRVSAAERSSRQHIGISHQRSNAQPSHPFIQDPAMPPLPPPNTLAQLEEARRRLQEEKKVSKTPKQRYSTSSLQRDRNHGAPSQGVSLPLSSTALLTSPTEEHKVPKKQVASPHAAQSSELVVTYFFCGEDIPYRRIMKGHSLTLAHFKEQLSKKGNYRYYFKRASNEFDCGAVFEEVQSDDSTLPMYEGKILGKVERID